MTMYDIFSHAGSGMGVTVVGDDPPEEGGDPPADPVGSAK
jgi:hypothetical protein